MRKNSILTLGVTTPVVSNILLNDAPWVAMRDSPADGAILVDLVSRRRDSARQAGQSGCSAWKAKSVVGILLVEAFKVTILIHRGAKCA